MKVAKADVERLANLARLELCEEEKAEMARQLSSIVEYAKRLDQVDTVDVSPMIHPVHFGNVFREDVAGPSLDVEEALANAPDRDGAFFRVPRILEGD